jgi:hypothetical protein
VLLLAHQSAAGLRLSLSHLYPLLLLDYGVTSAAAVQQTRWYEVRERPITSQRQFRHQVLEPHARVHHVCQSDIFNASGLVDAVDVGSGQTSVVSSNRKVIEAAFDSRRET